MRIPLAIAILLINLAPLQAADPFEFHGDRLISTFTKGQERTELSGNAQITSGDLVMKADSIELRGNGFRYVTCTGSVVVKDTKKNLLLKADSMVYDRTLKLSRFSGRCEIDDPDQEVTVRAGLFDYDENADTTTLQSGVRIFKGDLVCRSDFAIYNRKADTLDMTGLPVVNKKTDEFHAGSIHVDLKTEDVLLDGRVSGTITPPPDKNKKPSDDSTSDDSTSDDSASSADSKTPAPKTSTDNSPPSPSSAKPAEIPSSPKETP